MSLFLVLGAMAQAKVVVSTAENPEYYVIASYDRGGYLTNKGVGNSVEHVNLEDGSYWYFEKANEDGGVYFVNKLKNGENKIYLDGEKKASTESAIWYVIENGVNKNGLSAVFCILSTGLFNLYSLT